MNEALTKSLRAWVARNPKTNIDVELFTSVERAIGYSGLDLREKDGTPAFPGYQLLVCLAIQRLFDELEQPFAATESSTQRMLLSALVILGVAEGYDVELVSQHGGGKFDSFGMDMLRIEVQAELGEYRVDFVLEQDSLSHGLMRAEKGEFPRVRHRLVVECDKRQLRASDRARDKALIAFGYPVHRLRESDVSPDAIGVANKLLKALRDGIRRTEDQERERRRRGGEE